MVSVWHITPLLLATVVLADYYIDNADTSILYSMAPSQSGQAWQLFSVNTQVLQLQMNNSTGNYTMNLDASHCYDQSYSLGICGTNDDCFVQLPFTGSGITMYVFNAGFTGMTAGFSVDSGTAVSETVQAPPPPSYQVSNVSLYDIQGLPSGNHTMKMTVLNWDGSSTYMKFDYAYINESFVAAPARTTATSRPPATSTSQTPSQTFAGNPSTSNKVNLGGVIGGTLGGVTAIASVVFGIFYFRKRKALPQEEISSNSTFQVNPFGLHHLSIPTPTPNPYTSQRPFFAQHGEASPSVSPLQRFAILRDALAGSNYLSEPIRRSSSVSSRPSSPVFEPVRRQTTQNTDADLHGPRVADAGSPFSDPQTTSRCELTAEQLEVIDRLRMDGVPVETIRRVVEGFAPSRAPAREASSGQFTSDRSILSAVPPPSYRTRAS